MESSKQDGSEQCFVDDSSLCRLCLDDGQTFVTVTGDILTATYEAPKLQQIREYVQSTPSLAGGKFYGRSPAINLTTGERVEVMMELMLKQVNQESKAQGDDKSAMEDLLNSLCQEAVSERASDVHIEVHRTETRILLRVDGKRIRLQSFSNGDSALHQPSELGMKLAAYLFNKRGRSDFKVNEPNNDSFIIELAIDGKAKSFEWRVASIQLDKGLKVTMRCLTPTSTALSLEDMDLPPIYVSLLRQAISLRAGGIIFTGPMGSGKSSLVDALTSTIDVEARAVHTLEDPVEFEHAGVCKTAVDTTKETKTGSGQYRDFAFYDKQLLRHDTDVIVYGEIRDHRAAKAFCRKAETGGLALTTLHTNGVLGVPGTLIEQFNLPAAMISAPGLMRLFVHQRLVRKLCSCALPLDEAEPVYNQHALSGEFANKQEKLNTLFPGNLNSVKIVNPQGCEACGHKGEKGRLVVMEMVMLNTTDREFIAAQNYIGWEKHLASQGWPDIRQHTLQRIRLGQIDILSASEQVDSLIPVASEDVYRQMSEALS